MEREIIINPSDDEPTTTEQVIQQLNGAVSSTREALLKRAKEKNYDEAGVHRTLSYMNDKAALLAEGLIPAEDHSFLSGIIDSWFGMALTSAKYANELDQADRVARAAIDAVHVEMVINRIIKPEVQAELLRRWPVDRGAPATED